MKWVTRERPKIDRIACPWLIRRFIDPQAEFLYVPTDRVFAAVPLFAIFGFSVAVGTIAVGATLVLQETFDAAGALTLLEKERTKLAGSLDALTNPAAVAASDQENRLAQQIASLRKALADSDPSAVRQLISAVGSRRAQLP